MPIFSFYLYLTPSDQGIIGVTQNEIINCGRYRSSGKLVHLCYPFVEGCIKYLSATHQVDGDGTSENVGNLTFNLISI